MNFGYYTTGPLYPAWGCCNCACSVCLAGGCCQSNGTWPGAFPDTFIPSPPLPSFVPITPATCRHFFQKFDPKRLFCVHCGVTRAI